MSGTKEKEGEETYKCSHRAQGRGVSECSEFLMGMNLSSIAAQNQNKATTGTDVTAHVCYPRAGEAKAEGSLRLAEQQPSLLGKV